MLRFFSLLSFVVSFISASALTSGNSIPIPGASNVISSISSCYNSKNNQTIISWNSGNLGYYAIYDYKTLSFSTSSAQIPGAFPATNVDCCYNPTSNTVVFAWTDSTTQSPTYSIYDCQLIFSGPATPLSNTYTYGANGGYIYCCAGKDSVLFTWCDKNENAWFALYSIALSEFIYSPSFLQLVLSHPTSDVYSSYDPYNDVFAITWAVGTNVYLSTMKSNTPPGFPFPIYNYTKNIQYVFSAYNPSISGFVLTFSSDLSYIGFFTDYMYSSGAFSIQSSFYYLNDYLFPCSDLNNIALISYGFGASSYFVYNCKTKGASNTQQLSTNSEYLVFSSYSVDEAQFFFAWPTDRGEGYFSIIGDPAQATAKALKNMNTSHYQ